MMIDAHIADGRTVFRFKTRGNMISLINRNLAELESEGAVKCWVRWHPGDDFVPCRVMSLRGNSVSFTREVVGEERQAFDEQYPPPEKWDPAKGVEAYGGQIHRQ